MTKTAKKDPVMLAKAKLEKALGREVTIEETKLAMAAKEKADARELTVIAKYGKGSGRINRQTGKVEECDIVKGSMSYRENTNGIGGKWGVIIKCLDTQDKRWVATSDLHQVARSEAAQKDHKASLRKVKNAAKREAAKLDSTVVNALS